jgi:hypothetical protein
LRLGKKPGATGTGAGSRILGFPNPARNAGLPRADSAAALSNAITQSATKPNIQGPAPAGLSFCLRACVLGRFLAFSGVFRA